MGLRRWPGDSRDGLAHRGALIFPGRVALKWSRPISSSTGSKNDVVTLTSEVNSQGRRAQVEKVASAVPNVPQVVNELQVKDQKATWLGALKTQFGIQDATVPGRNTARRVSDACVLYET
jgi:hypothetical protein